MSALGGTYLHHMRVHETRDEARLQAALHEIQQRVAAPAASVGRRRHWWTGRRSASVVWSGPARESTAGLGLRSSFVDLRYDDRRRLLLEREQPLAPHGLRTLRWEGPSVETVDADGTVGRAQEDQVISPRDPVYDPVTCLPFFVAPDTFTTTWSARPDGLRDLRLNRVSDPGGHEATTQVCGIEGLTSAEMVVDDTGLVLEMAGWIGGHEVCRYVVTEVDGRVVAAPSAGRAA